MDISSLQCACVRSPTAGSAANGGLGRQLQLQRAGPGSGSTNSGSQSFTPKVCCGAPVNIMYIKRWLCMHSVKNCHALQIASPVKCVVLLSTCMRTSVLSVSACCSSS